MKEISGTVAESYIPIHRQQAERATLGLILALKPQSPLAATHLFQQEHISQSFQEVHQLRTKHADI